MGNYKLTEDAQADIIRIHQYGTRMYGEAQADVYFNAFFEHFDLLAEQPLLHPAVDHIRRGYRRSVCGIDSIYYQIEGESVKIMAIIGKQNTKKWL